MSSMDVARIAIAGVLVLLFAVLVTAISVAVYLECIRPHLAERAAQKPRRRRVVGLRLVVERERESEVKQQYDYRQSS